MHPSWGFIWFKKRHLCEFQKNDTGVRIAHRHTASCSLELTLTIKDLSSSAQVAISKKWFAHQRPSWLQFYSFDKNRSPSLCLLQTRLAHILGGLFSLCSSIQLLIESLVGLWNFAIADETSECRASAEFWLKKALRVLWIFHQVILANQIRSAQIEYSQYNSSICYSNLFMVIWNFFLVN